MCVNGSRIVVNLNKYLYDNVLNLNKIYVFPIYDIFKYHENKEETFYAYMYMMPVHDACMFNYSENML